MNPSRESVESLAAPLRRLKHLGVEDVMLAWILVQIRAARSFLDQTNSAISPRLLLDLMIMSGDSSTRLDSPPYSEPYSLLLWTFDTLVKSGEITLAKKDSWVCHSRASAITLLRETGLTTFHIGSTDTVTVQWKQTQRVLSNSESLALQQLLVSSQVEPSRNWSEPQVEFIQGTLGTMLDESDLTIRILWHDS